MLQRSTTHAEVASESLAALPHRAMGGDGERRGTRSDAAVEPITVITVSNPGDEDGGPSPMLAVPVEHAALFQASPAAASPSSEPEVLHVRCSGCNLVVQFPLIQEVRRHGIVCSVCSTVSFPYVDGHLNGNGAAAASGFTSPAQRGAPRSGADPSSNPGAAVLAISRVAKSFSLAHFFLLVVDALIGTAPLIEDEALRYVGFVTVVLPAVGYVGASLLRIELVMVRTPRPPRASALLRPCAWLRASPPVDLRHCVVPQAYFVLCLGLVGYHVWAMYVTKDVWQLLLLLLELYLARVVLKLATWMRALAARPADAGAGSHPNALAELRATSRLSLSPCGSS